MTNPFLILLYNIQELWPPRATYSSTDVPDLAGKVFLVTGGNTGIGKETARVLLEHNAKVYITSRSAEKGREAADDLKRRTGKTDADLLILPLDLSDLASVKAAAEEFTLKEPRLDVLINNAGVMVPPLTSLTKHGHDLQFGTNVLGHFYFTQLLLPLLISTSKSSSDGKARIVNLSSNGHWGAFTGKDGPIHYETLTDGPQRNKVTPFTLYSQSKAGNVLVSNALARKYGEQGIVSTSLNPGAIESDLNRHVGSFQQRIAKFLFLQPIEFGALTTLYAATSPEGATFNGKYLGPWARIRPNRDDLDDVATQEKLWSWLEEQVKLYAP